MSMKRLPLEEGMHVCIPLNRKQDYLNAIAEGYKDEVCGKCRGFFAPYHHFLTCRDDDCPMKSCNKSILEMWQEELANHNQKPVSS